MTIKTGFVTCVELGVSCMRAIYRAGGRIDFAITLPDEKSRAKSGRVFLDEFCAQRSIHLLKTPNINDSACVEFLRQQRPDVLFIIGWSQIARGEVLNAASRVIGMHPTLLPEGRGRAAIPWAIIKSLSKTGVTMFELDGGVDSGPLLAQVELPLGDRETAASLYARVAEAHAQLIERHWASIENQTLIGRPQDHERATYWPARTPSDGELRPTLTVDGADRLVRAITRPYPGAFLRRGEAVLRIWAGRPATEDSPSSGGLRIRFADGDYDATEWEREA